MTKEDLIKGNELEVLIQTTLTGLSNLDSMKKRFLDKEFQENTNYQDKMYNLSICEHRDGSGSRVELNRYFGNKELIEVITSTLEKQIDGWRKELKEL